MRKVLVVEDSPAMRELIGSLVDELGDIQVTEAENGLDALHLLPNENFDLILTDINMPNLNGLELIAFIRKNQNHSETPILVVTTEAAVADRDKASALGATAFLIKRFEHSELIEKVKRLLG